MKNKILIIPFIGLSLLSTNLYSQVNSTINLHPIRSKENFVDKKSNIYHGDIINYRLYSTTMDSIGNLGCLFEQFFYMERDSNVLSSLLLDEKWINFLNSYNEGRWYEIRVNIKAKSKGIMEKKKGYGNIFYWRDFLYVEDIIIDSLYVGGTTTSREKN